MEKLDSYNIIILYLSEVMDGKHKEGKVFESIPYAYNHVFTYVLDFRDGIMAV